MKREVVEPDDAKLTARLRECRPAPQLPPRFQQAVWRRIEREQAALPANAWLARLDQLAEWLLRPRRALAGITALVLLGAIAGALTGTSAAKQTARERYLAVVAPNPIR